MDLIPATAGIDASGRCIVRANRLVHVKFVALPVEPPPGNVLRETPRLGDCWGRLYPGGAAILRFASRVIGRLVAARP